MFLFICTFSNLRLSFKGGEDTQEGQEEEEFKKKAHHVCVWPFCIYDGNGNLCFVTQPKVDKLQLSTSGAQH